MDLTPELSNATLKMAGSLIFVIGLILLLVYLLKRFRFGPLSLHRSSALRLLGSLTLAPKRSIALIEIHNQWLVIGVGTDKITLLSRLNRPEEFTLPYCSRGQDQNSFSGLVQHILAGKGKLKQNDDRRPDENRG